MYVYIYSVCVCVCVFVCLCVCVCVWIGLSHFPGRVDARACCPRALTGQVKVLVEANRHIEGLHARARLYEGTVLVLPGHDRSADPVGDTVGIADGAAADSIPVDEAMPDAPPPSPPPAVPPAVPPPARIEGPLRARDESSARKRRRPGWYMEAVGEAPAHSDGPGSHGDAPNGRSRRLSRLEACLGRIRNHRMQRSAGPVPGAEPPVQPLAEPEAPPPSLPDGDDAGSCSDSDDDSAVSASSDDDAALGAAQPASLPGLPPWLQECTWSVHPRSLAEHGEADQQKPGDADDRTLLVVRAAGAGAQPRDSTACDAACHEGLRQGAVDEPVVVVCMPIGEAVPEIADGSAGSSSRVEDGLQPCA